MSNGQLVRAVACEVRGTGFYSSSDQLFFLSSGIGGRNLMDPNTINCVIFRIQVGKINKNNSQPCHLAANQCKCKVWEQKNEQVYLSQVSHSHRLFESPKKSSPYMQVISSPGRMSRRTLTQARSRPVATNLKYENKRMLTRMVLQDASSAQIPPSFGVAVSLERCHSQRNYYRLLF